MRKFDVLGIGTVAVDELIVADRYPPADCKVRVQHAERQCGGLTATALVAAARLGARCAYAGALGSDELSKFAIAQLRREEIDLRHLKIRPNTPPPHSFIVIDPKKLTRNVFSFRAVPHRLGANWPPRKVIEAAKVLLVDHSDLPGTIRAARIARNAGVAVVADVERDSGPRFGELLSLVDHLIVSWKFAATYAGSRTSAAAVASLWSDGRRLVAVTCGRKGCWFRTSESSRVLHQPAFIVETVDTTGCGDVFHGAYAAALVDGLGPAERIRFASAAAALKAQRLGAQAGIPNRRSIATLLRP